MAEQPTISDSAVAAALAAIGFDGDGLVPAIAQAHDTGEVLMMAWMNRDAVAETLRTGRVCYFSRSRNALWRKGESSGQVQVLVDFRFDCDNDTVLVLVDQTGVACHTGRRSCFFNAVRGDGIETISEVQIDPEKLYGE
jgi:phosphoribosyl-AMP cyclohydrolase